MPPKVSVLIATYNKAEALRYAVESVLWQTLGDFELWVIGDGATDHSEEVVASFNDSRVHWHNLPENTGYQSEPHNEGLRRAAGQYVAYLNHDDIWLPNHLEELVKGIEEAEADFAYSILEWVLSYAENYADIPIYPDAPRPPEASATLHRRCVVDEIGYWKPPEETRAVPRAEYFRRAQFQGSQFALVPMLTVLKFGGSDSGYSAAGAQPKYMSRIREDGDFAHRRLAELLVSSHSKLERPVTPRALIHQLSEQGRRALVRNHIDPADVAFWRKRGSHIRIWKRDHKLA